MTSASWRRWANHDSGPVIQQVEQAGAGGYLTKKELLATLLH
jgi:hypothetical protein